MGLTLGIDTSSTEMGLGLVEGTTVIGGYCRYRANSHAETIHDALEFLLRSNGAAPADIVRAGIAVGPGSFTGLRIGIAFLKGLFFKRPVGVLALSSLEVIARGIVLPPDAQCIVALDARQGQVFWAEFKNTENGIVRMCEDSLDPATTMHRRITPETFVVADRLGYAKSTVFESVRDHPRFCFTESRHLQRGMVCARRAAATADDSPDWTKPMAVLPRYMQGSPVQRNRLSNDKEHVS